MGQTSARLVRTCIQLLRRRGEAITLGTANQGYVHLDSITDETKRAETVKAHRCRTAAYMVDHAQLCRQIGKMTAIEIAQQTLFDLLIPVDDEQADRPSTMEHLARLPAAKRAGVTKLLFSLLEGIEADPQAFAYERAVLADRFRGIFLTRADAAKLAQAKKLLEEVGI